jgi:anthranilate synthase component 2
LKLLVLDNYDSFTYNLVHLIEKVSDISFDVIRNDKISIEEVSQYNKILLSPGPGLPKDAGIMTELLMHYKATKSILGICLGMQAIGESYGASLENLNTVVHGQATPINILNNDLLFKDCPSQFYVGRYHSWVINSLNLSDSLIVTSVDREGYIMSIKHKYDDIRGVQFHPESILSEYGETIIKNWLSV